MRLYFFGFIMLCQKFILRQSTGHVISVFAKRMGVVYIKVAQILAMQNCGNIFTEADRQALAGICDHCNPVPFSKIQSILEEEYQRPLSEIFRSIDEIPLGSASISQVHRAVLKDGRVVAVKVKRADIVRRVKHDTAQIKRLIHRFGRIAKFRNFLGSDKALEYYVDWIYEETNFEHETHNIVAYQEFADSVNHKVSNCKKIVIPKAYTELCTTNIIVMEFISDCTVNQLALTPENKQKISEGINDYLRLSFYALLHDMPVTFHGDPHGGNIYLDQQGNLGFLDMGLVFNFSGKEVQFIRNLFIDSYAGKIDFLIETLLEQSEFQYVDRPALERAMQEKVDKFHDIPVPQFFVEMIGVFTQYDVAPPQILFKMAKAFLAIFGIGTFTENIISTQELLAGQVAEFYINRTADDIRTVIKGGLKLLPDFLSMPVTPRRSIANGLREAISLNQQVIATLKHAEEALELIKGQKI